jgi:hypothetical protein
MRPLIEISRKEENAPVHPRHSAQAQHNITIECEQGI